MSYVKVLPFCLQQLCVKKKKKKKKKRQLFDEWQNHLIIKKQNIDYKNRMSAVHETENVFVIVRRQQVDSVDHCTHTHEALIHSYRAPSLFD